MSAEIESNRPPSASENETDIAIVGMVCHFPGASDTEAFWKNLADGIESITRLSDEQMIRAGVSSRFLNDSNYVKAAPILAGPGLFDAAFFGFSPAEAENMDPQHRLLLELSYEALEDAGCDPDRFPGRIGVFTGAAMNTYFMNSGLTSRFLEDYIPTLIVNDKDFLSTRISYKLNLKGPSITIQTACSTSLVAVHLARQSLLSGESDMALAGAVSVRVPHEAGYFCDGGGVVSPDGHVRAFDAKANGTVFGSGGGIVVLKRLTDAIANRDTIHAVIKGSAVNNDGSEKAGYTAPSVNSQADVVVEALANAGVDADSISFIEAHGSGTPVGDPIELAALTKAFRSFTQRKNYCAVGSVKTNIGHLDAAAGIAGLIKAVLALKHRRLPPSLHYREPNPEINFSETPFYVNSELAAWNGTGPKRAGVMSTGMGGTNAHVVLEEASREDEAARTDLPQLLVLSTKSASTLDSATDRLREFLQNNPAANIADVAYTLQTGRKTFSHRRILVCSDSQDAVVALSGQNANRLFSSQVDESKRRRVIFLLPGIGDHYVAMAHGLYEKWKLFKETVDRCAEILEPHLGIDIRKIIYPDGFRRRAANANKGIDLRAMLSRKDAEANNSPAHALNQTIYAQPALFVIEYALACLWQRLGVIPEAIVGHSMGEYVAACLSGVFSLEDALFLISQRAKLANELPQGAMLAVLLNETELLPLLNDQLSISLINGPNLCVVAGPPLAVAELEKSLNAKGIITRQVRNAHGFHSRMLDPMVPAFVNEVRKVKLHEPRIPFTSNLTGDWIAKEQATNPEYWAQHACRTARFSDALHTLWQIDNPLLLEIGPGKTLSVLAAQHPDQHNSTNAVTTSSLRHDYENQSDIDFFLQSIGRLWLSGLDVDWEKLPQAERRRRIPLPTYPFERQNYWLKSTALPTSTAPEVTIHKNSDLSKWFYIPSWKRTLAKGLTLSDLTKDNNKRRPWLVFASEAPLLSRIVDRLKKSGRQVVTVRLGSAFQQLDASNFILEPSNPRDYDELIQILQASDRIPGHIIHALSLSKNNSRLSDEAEFQRAQELGFYSLLFFVKALANHSHSDAVDLFALSDSIQDVYGNEAVRPDKATLLGPCVVIPQEYANIRTKSIDLLNGEVADEAAINRIIGEFFNHDGDTSVSYRNSQRWVRTYEPVELDKQSVLRKEGVYLITGGLGNIGYEISRYLAEQYRARLVLLGRYRLPERSSWDAWITTHQSDDPVSDKIAKITSLEKLGAEVLYLDAKLNDLSSMRDTIDQALTRFGALHGVIHAVGVTGDQRYHEVKSVDREHGDTHFQLKAHALAVLEKLLQDKALDFVLLISSLTSVLGGIGHVAYASSCIHMDTLARKLNRTSLTPWLSVNWDFWRTGRSDVAAGRTVRDLGMNADEAMQVLETVLPIRHAGQILVSTGDLEARYKQWVKLESLHQEERLELRPSNLKRLEERSSLQTNCDAPRTDTEMRISQIWQRTLGIERIGINDNFSDLGGHSLLAIKIIAELRKAFEVDLPIKALFEAPTIAELSRYIRNGHAESSSPKTAHQAAHEQRFADRPNELLEEIKEEYPELQAEDAFIVPQWFVQQTTWLAGADSDSAVYNYPLLLRIRGSIDKHALQLSLLELSRRHEVFRSTFRLRDNELVQIVVPPFRHELNVTDFTDSSESEREDRVRQFALEKSNRPFDFAHEPLLRSELIRLGSEEHMLLLTTHHLVYDDWSTAVLSRELSQLYQAFANGKTPPVTDLKFQYGDFVRWQQTQLTDHALQAHRSYWKKELTSRNGFYHLPTDFARPERSSGRGAREAIVLPADLAEALHTFRRRERVSLFMVLATAFKCLLYQSSNQEEIGIGSCGANRPFAEAEELIGRFGNAMLLRTSFAGNPTLRELLTRVRATALSAYSNQNLPFGQVVQELAEGEELVRPPFQAMFILQNAPQENPQLPGLKMEWSPFYNGTAKYDLDVWLKAEPELEVIFEYRTDLFLAETMKLHLANYVAILKAMVKDPGIRIGDLPKNGEFAQSRSNLVAAKMEFPVDVVTLPANDVEKRLLELWKSVFKVRPIAVDQDFFELGGDSLLAARLFPQIEKAFNINLPLAALLEAPTIQRLAQKIESHSLGSCLVPIQTSGSKAPLFCIHGHMGEVFYCRNLSKALGVDQPLYGLRSYGLGDRPPHHTIQEMAIHNLNEIARIQPKGPYLLSGYCLGGMVAYEMARLLDEQGEKVSLLVLFNTPAPGSFKGWPFGRAYLKKRVAHELKKLREVSFRRKLSVIGNKGMGFAKHASGSLKATLAKSSLGGAEKAAQKLLSVADINISAAKAYAPPAYSGRIILFLTDEASSLYSVDPEEGWTPLAANGVEVHAAGGDNNSLFAAPFVDALAERLKSCIENVQLAGRSDVYSGSSLKYAKDGLVISTAAAPI